MDKACVEILAWFHGVVAVIGKLCLNLNGDVV
jgi:hypothetical protein